MRQPVNQGTLLHVLNDIFPHSNIFNDARQVLRNPDTGQVLELDCWLPDINLAFEFQDDYHYSSKWYKHETIESVKLKDGKKRAAVLERGDTFVAIPFWWDGSKESAMAEIAFHRSDLFPSEIDEICEIPLNPPFYSQKTNSYIPSHLPELMSPSFPAISQILNVNESSPWWLGEKYDGIRVCWNPDSQILTTRTDQAIWSFESYSHFFPAIFLDGELWCGRNNFSQCYRLLITNHFAFMRVMVFDCPILDDLFEERYQQLLDVCADHPFIKLAPRLFFNSLDQVEWFTKCILEQGGEGSILQKPRTIYTPGRSDSVLKLKAHQRDGDALVVETHDEWFTIKLLHGVLIPLEESNLADGVEIEKGDIVTFSYDAINFHSLPSHIKILRVRNDITWQDLSPTEDFSEIISNAEKRQIMLNAESARAFGQLKTITTINKFSTQELQTFFNTLATILQIDPKKEDEWYSLTSQKLRSLKGGRTIEQYCGGIVSALQRAYPHMKFDPFKFEIKRKYFWEEPKNLRHIFDQYAKSIGFDPQVPANWYKYISNPSLAAFGIRTRGSYIKMLQFAYPNIALDPAKFYRNPQRRLFIQKSEQGPSYAEGPKITLDVSKKKESNEHWKDVTNQKAFFDLFAKTNKFDPLQAENWAPILTKDINATGKGRSIMKYYQGNDRLYTALKRIYNF
eukprot:Phypoly_transcript_04439.p1 GENE.Phypoly_transcript_04439~~Phypoly_transcript_04439.p1  ORF type:complete len:682 (+),score=95.71 Phypoly_transcript_04439:71-2116(+)